MQQNGKGIQPRTRKRKVQEGENELFEKIARDYAIEFNNIKKNVKKILRIRNSAFFCWRSSDSENDPITSFYQRPSFACHSVRSLCAHREARTCACSAHAHPRMHMHMHMHMHMRCDMHMRNAHVHVHAHSCACARAHVRLRNSGTLLSCATTTRGRARARDGRDRETRSRVAGWDGSRSLRESGTRYCTYAFK